VSRIAARFAALKRAGRGALIPFVEAYDPDAATSLALLRGMPGAGADLIEIGIPFTDPMADGPIIQVAGKRALAAGVKVTHVLSMVREFLLDDDATPIILMGYLNPVLSYGAERFCTDAAAAGVDGLIMVDLPTEESDMLVPHATAVGIDIIRLVRRPPTTSVCLWCWRAVRGSSTMSASPASRARGVRRLNIWERPFRAFVAYRICR
jgi:tryptophan synthase alpha chain